MFLTSSTLNKHTKWVVFAREASNLETNVVIIMWRESILSLFIFFPRKHEPLYGTAEAWRRKKERTMEGETKRNSTNAGQSYSLKSGDSFGRLRRWYLLGSIHKVAMATGQPGLSTPQPKSGKPVGPTNGRMYPGVRYWWLVVRANPRRADSRFRYTCLSHRWNCFVCIANSRTRTCKKTPRSSYIQFAIFTQHLHIRTTKSWHGQHIHEVYPQNCPRSSLPRSVSCTVQPPLHSLFKKPIDSHLLGGDFICIRKRVWNSK